MGARSTKWQESEIAIIIVERIWGLGEHRLVEGSDPEVKPVAGQEEARL